MTRSSVVIVRLYQTFSQNMFQQVAPGSIGPVKLSSALVLPEMVQL